MVPKVQYKCCFFTHIMKTPLQSAIGSSVAAILCESLSSLPRLIRSELKGNKEIGGKKQMSFKSGVPIILRDFPLSP